jgi:hypothetical protein
VPSDLNDNRRRSVTLWPQFLKYYLSSAHQLRRQLQSRHSQVVTEMISREIVQSHIVLWNNFTTVCER